MIYIYILCVISFFEVTLNGLMTFMYKFNKLLYIFVNLMFKRVGFYSGKQQVLHSQARFNYGLALMQLFNMFQHLERLDKNWFVMLAQKIGLNLIPVSFQSNYSSVEWLVTWCFLIHSFYKGQPYNLTTFFHGNDIYGPLEISQFQAFTGHISAPKYFSVIVFYLNDHCIIHRIVSYSPLLEDNWAVFSYLHLSTKHHLNKLKEFVFYSQSNQTLTSPLFGEAHFHIFLQL